jgi:uncharacterized protein (UPF0303 family)
MPVEQDLAIIAAQERQLRFERFGEEDAWKLGVLLREICISRQFPVVIDIHRTGHPLFYSALAGSAPDNAEWARRKGNVVARFHRSSYGMGLELQQRNATLEARYGLPLSDFAAHGGSFPLTVSGVGVIGSVTVSGLPQREDHELVVEALCTCLGQDHATLRLPL